MSKPVLATAIVVACFVLAACSPSEDSPSGSLTGKTWQWTASAADASASQSAVSDPADYTLVFLKGSFIAKADCNSVSGTYVTTSSGGVTMKPTSSTEHVCATDSLAEAYVADLSSAASYAFDDGKLEITLSEEGTMTFE